MINFKRGSVAVLELSSGGVKLLLGPARYNTFNPDNFRYYKTVTKTKNGLEGNIMNINWFKENVLPTIQMYLDYSKGCKIIGVATAWARDCNNINKIFDILPIPIKILSGEEEARMSLLGYINSTSRNLKDWDNVISMDLGNLSSEISILGGKSLSVQNNQKRQLDSIFSSLSGKTLVALSKQLYNGVTGKPDKMILHDKPFPINRNEVFLNYLISNLSKESLMVYNGTNLSFGVYYNNIQGSKKI